MKLLICLTGIFLLLSSVIFADEIRLKDSSVIRCEIIQVTDNNIEYREPGGRPFLTVSRDLVREIVYDDGRTEQITQNKKYDKIYLKDGQVIEGKVIKVTQDVIIYTGWDSDKKEALVRENVVKIELADAHREIKQGEEAGQEQNTEPAIQTGGYIDSLIQVGFLFYYGTMWGELDTKENSAYDRYKDRLELYPVYPSDYNSYINHYKSAAGITVAIMLPSKKYKRSSFGLTGIKYGIICNYVYSEVVQNFYDIAISDEIYRGTLLQYHTVNFGPDINYIMGSPAGLVSIIPHFYLLGGYIYKGTIKAVPGLRDAGLYFNLPDYKSNFTGYTGTLGTGVRFAFNRGFPFYFEFNLQYTYSQIKLEKSLAVYDSSDKEISFNDMGFMFSMGVYL